MKKTERKGSVHQTRDQLESQFETILRKALESNNTPKFKKQKKRQKQSSRGARKALEGSKKETLRNDFFSKKSKKSSKRNRQTQKVRDTPKTPGIRLFQGIHPTYQTARTIHKSQATRQESQSKFPSNGEQKVDSSRRRLGSMRNLGEELPVLEFTETPQAEQPRFFESYQSSESKVDDFDSLLSSKAYKCPIPNHLRSFQASESHGQNLQQPLFLRKPKSSILQSQNCTSFVSSKQNFIVNLNSLGDSPEQFNSEEENFVYIEPFVMDPYYFFSNVKKGFIGGSHYEVQSCDESRVLKSHNTPSHLNSTY